MNGGTRSFTLRMPEIDAEGRLVSKERTLNVQVPKGILAGQQIRLAGQGASAHGDGKPGDLYIEVEFQPDPLYRVDGRDLYLELPVAPWEAALGATVKTPTPGGNVELKIPVWISCREQIAAERPGNSRDTAGRFLCRAADRPTARQRAKKPRPPMRRWLPPEPSTLAPALESNMSPADDPALPGTIFDESAILSIKDLSRMCAVDERHIVEFVEEGVLSVVNVSSEWRFTGDALRRARLAVRLERDLELNLAGVALAIELLEELAQLRRELERRDANEQRNPRLNPMPSCSLARPAIWPTRKSFPRSMPWCSGAAFTSRSSAWRAPDGIWTSSSSVRATA